MKGTRSCQVSAALAAALLAVAAGARPAGDARQVSPEARSVAYLAREVPQWRREHPCYSCHNNGDAARALIAASRRGHDTREALADTLQWLSEPHRWDTNAKGGGFEDLTLARIQFAAATRDAARAKMARAPSLTAAAGLIAGDQDEDGAWRLDVSQSIGSPATYGTTLATWSARETLEAAKRPDDNGRIARANDWLRTAPVATVLDAAAVVLGIGYADDDPALAQRLKALDTIKRGQGPDGGWGPYVSSRSEPFDTAVVILALSRLHGSWGSAESIPFMPAEEMFKPYTSDELSAAVLRARMFLLKQQIADGSWPETTRPAQQESYAQRISTTAWATLALFHSARYVERYGERLRVRRAIGPLERVDFERPADPIAREIFEH